MKIKDITKYRSFYKQTRPVSPDLEEDFIGNYYIDKETNEKKFGWFTMYHGDRDGFGTPEKGIENFLESFLDMAKDGQAVYEFLQNAVDAGSTHYTMIWGEDEIDGNHYLLVANNGEMFTPNSVRSILNVGSSTKTADSQTIGKFGIGFKLAHRLVGKDNGLQELINDNSGPILFSWKNYEIEELAQNLAPVPSSLEISNNNKGEINIEDENPWLFKILITCFPCSPSNEKVVELPRLVDGTKSDENPFNKNEYEVLSRWVKKNQNILNKETYEEGALFFIKLGKGKETEMADLNLKEGVKFALAILKETAESEIEKEQVLKTVQLNNEEPITYPDLQYIKLSIDKENDKKAYAYIRFGVDDFEKLSKEQQKLIQAEADIEALFGFREYDKIEDYFKGAPNFYLYFPLSEEVHNFNYILHSNAFYKGSSRTFLHKGNSKEDGINERLLKEIVIRIDKELERLSLSILKEERELFLHFYAALLTSRKSGNEDRLWIEKPYIDPLDELLKKYIPIRKSWDSDEFEISNNPDQVFIKKSDIEINTTAWNIENTYWFYWDNKEYDNICNSASIKLGIYNFSIYHLFSAHDTISQHINTWLKQNKGNIEIVLNEIANLDDNQIKESRFKNNLFAIEILEFNNNERISINAFQEKESNGYFIIYNKLNDITDVLQKLDLKYTKQNFDDYNFQQKYFNYFGGNSQVRSYTILTKLFSKVVSNEKLGALSVEDKFRIFEAFRTLNETPGERMGELKLCKNNQNIPVCFKNLYAKSTTAWLSKFSIKESEDNPAYKKYLLNKTEEIYEGIIFPFWGQILDYIAKNPTKSTEVLDEVVVAYVQSGWSEKESFLLNSNHFILFQSKVLKSEQIYFNEELISLSNEVYSSVQSTVFSYYNIHIPDKCLIEYLSKEPFSSISVSFNAIIDDKSTTLDDLNDLLIFASKCNISFFDDNCIIRKNNEYFIESSTNKKQIATSKPLIVKYSESYYPNDFVLIPEIFNGFKNLIELSGNTLIEHLIEIFDEKNDAQELDLIEIVLGERSQDKKELLEGLTYTILDTSWENQRKNKLYLNLLKEVAEKDISEEELAVIYKKISINKDDTNIIVGDVDSANDSIAVYRKEKKIILSQSQILSLDNADNIKLIHEFYLEAINRDLINKSTADKIFKISNAGITNELVNRFKENLKENLLVNSHQLLFVLLSAKFDKKDLSQYKLKSQDNKKYDLSGTLITYSEISAKHINPPYLIHESYSDLQSLLDLNDLEVFSYGENEEDIIASRFLFVKGCNPDILDSELSISEKLDYLYNGYKNLDTQIQINKGSKDWKIYLSFNPNEFLLNGLALESEILPTEVLAWYNNDTNKNKFLMALGINVNLSPINKLRKFLISESIKLDEIIDVNRFNNKLLWNTLIGISGDFSVLKKEPIIFNMSNHFLQIEKIIEIINSLSSSKVDNIPVLVYHTINSFKIVNPTEQDIYVIEETLHEDLKESENNKLLEVYQSYNILFQEKKLTDEIRDNYDDIEFVKTFAPSVNRLEHNEPFYNSWSENNKIKLFKQDELLFDISIHINECNTIIGQVQDDEYYTEIYDDESYEITYNKKLRLEDLSERIDGDLKVHLDHLIEARDRTLSAFYHALTSSGRGQFDDDDTEQLLKNLNKKSIEEERTKIIEELKDDVRYSYNWFINYINYLLSFDDIEETTAEKSITFQKIKSYKINDVISNKYFLLEGANSLIPVNIEVFEDFNISLAFKNNKKENIKIEGVSKKGQDLLIYIPDGIKSSIVNNFNLVVNIKINFQPKLDLTKRLFDAFSNTKIIEPWDDIFEECPSIKFIYGPPGTGKTTKLCDLIIDNCNKNPYNKSLILVPTNKAGDVLAKKICFKNPDLNIIRIGNPTDPELEEFNPEIYQSSLDDAKIQKANVVISSIHRFPYYQINVPEGPSYKLFSNEIKWSSIIFDESSMISLPYIVFALMVYQERNNEMDIIVAGDPKQIPPVVNTSDKDLEELKIDDENIYKMFGIKSFKTEEQNEILRSQDSIDNLGTQYRSVDGIGNLFSQFSYDNLLKNGRDFNLNPIKDLPKSFIDKLKKPISLINFPIDVENSVLTPKKLLYSSYHVYAGILTTELIRYFDQCNTENKKYTIGIISPYKAQALLMNKLIVSSGISDNIQIYCDTVHGFQGDECDIVIFLINPNNTYYSGHKKALLSKEYIYNVAISRAKNNLWILNPFNHITNNPYVNQLKDILNISNNEIISSHDIENILFGKKDFIESNSYLTGHDNINVFGQVEMKYFIKAGNSAIDIQLKS